MKILIEKASSDTFWYAQHIGEIFEAELCKTHDFFEYQMQYEKGIRYIVQGDAKLVE